MRGGVSGGREGSGGRGGYGLAVTEGTYTSAFIWMFHSFPIKLWLQLAVEMTELDKTEFLKKSAFQIQNLRES